ncbi:uncharacterized protein LOC123680431 isoform X1 [Harmonia axyridis]|uniref:uncharacterized protein LOC123680431 isoform X1 n=1 Tax=Harmonia axyridis TaxID=115357 RepID=UPI001E276EFB|nr:uncharacterized protein LOC123680431 isoform X1 [Harmonia axyridis]
MFYDRRRDLDRFAMAWVASTRGVKFSIRKFGPEKILEIKITILCQEMMELIMSSSNNPEERVSLRMTVHLIEGTIKIFNEQVTLFQDDLFRYYTLLTTIPKQISAPERELDATQRIFRTPPTPIIKEKKKKRISTKRVAPILEEILGEEATNLDLITKPPRVPSAVEARRESIEIIDPQPIQVVLPDEMFGEFDVGPTEIPKDAPPKPPSEASVKSQLERIEELLAVEYQESVQKQTKKSSSSSADQGFQVIQVEAMVHRSDIPMLEERVEVIERQKKPREKIVTSESSNGMQETPKQILVEAMVHTSAEPQEAVITVDQPPATALSVQLPIGDLEEIQSVQEIAPTAALIVPAPIGASEEIQPVQETAPLDVIKTTRKTLKEGREQRGKEEMIAKRLRLKFRTARRVLLLDDYNKIVVVEDDFPITIFSETELLHDELFDFLMQTGVDLESTEKTIEQMRGITSRSFSSGLRRRLSKVPTSLTPIEGLSRLDSNIPSSVEVMKELNVPIMQSTPFKGDDVELPQVKLYEEIKLDFEFPIQEITEVQKEPHRADKTIPEVAEKEPEQLAQSSHADEPSPRKREEARIKRNILDKMKNWDDSQEYILFDDLIPEPKTRLNAARTFYFLLTFTKEQILSLLPEENSLEVKYVKRGRMLL